MLILKKTFLHLHLFGHDVEGHMTSSLWMLSTSIFLKAGWDWTQLNERDKKILAHTQNVTFLISTNSFFFVFSSCYRRWRHWLPVCHLPHPPPGLPHEEEGRGQLRPGREETLRRSLSEGPNQGVLCIKRPAPSSSRPLLPASERQMIAGDCGKSQSTTTANPLQSNKKQARVD